MSGSGLMNILVCGLGLIGASLAKTLKKNTNHHIMGWNRTDSVAKRALADGVIDETGELEAMMPKADVTIVNFYPEAIAPFIKEHKDLFKKNSIVTDSCGIKTKICRELEKENFDFYFVGAHPMAGREVSGYDNSLDDLFDNASFICTPCDSIPRYISDALVGLAQEMGFARTVVTTPEHHDEMIAFTSQIAHVLACSYVLSPLAPYHAGYSAGSYRLVSNLMKFKYCIVNEDANELCELMKKGNKIKEEIG